MNRYYKVLSALIILSVFFVPAVTGANDPGHDSLYIERSGDNVSGTFNFSGTFYVPSPGSAMEAATRQYVDNNFNEANESIWNQSGSDIYYNEGNVGIGTDSPGSSLDVNGSLEVGTNNALYLNESSGNLGLGTTPDVPLHLEFTGDDTDAGGGGKGVFFIDAEQSSIDSEPVFRVNVPSSGARKAFQLGMQDKSWSWASFSFTSGPNNKPGFMLGNAEGERDVGVFRQGADDLRLYNDVSVAGSLDLLSDNITNAGNITASGVIEADKFVGDGSGLTNVSSSGGSLWTNSSGNATYTDGNVGIGTTSPNALLTTESNTTDFMKAVLPNGSQVLKFNENVFDLNLFKESSTGDFLVDSETFRLDAAKDSDNTYIKGQNWGGLKLNAPNRITLNIESNNGIDLQGKGNTALWVDSNQNVGVQTSTPQESLEVNGTGLFREDLNVTSSNDICIEGGNCLSNVNTNTTASPGGSQGAVQYNDGNGGFSGNATQLFLNRTDGDVGIGTSSPEYGLHLQQKSLVALQNISDPDNLSSATEGQDLKIELRRDDFGTFPDGSKIGEIGFESTQPSHPSYGASAGILGRVDGNNGPATLELYAEDPQADRKTGLIVRPSGNVDAMHNLKVERGNLILNKNNNSASTHLYSQSYNSASRPTNLEMRWTGYEKEGEFVFNAANDSNVYQTISVFDGNTGYAAFGGDFQPTASLDVKKRAGQTDPLLNVRDSSGDVLVTTDSEGRVGIGTPTPNNDLDINGSNPTLNIDSDSAGGSGLSITSGDSDNIEFDSESYDRYHFKTTGDTRLFIDDDQTGSGDVGINTTSPSNALTVDGIADFTGDVGIGTTSPNSALDVSGTAQASTSLETGSLVLHNSDGLYRGNSNKANVRFGSEKANGARPLILESGDGSSYTDGEVNINVDGETQAKINSSETKINNDVNVNGSVTLNPEGSKPSCTSSNAGEMWFDDRNGSNGNDDLLYTCMENSTAEYNWVLVARGG